MRKETQQLWTLVEPHVEGAGLELVELQWSRESDGWVLRVYIDHPWRGEAPSLPGAAPAEDLFPRPAVGFQECERVSRDLSAALDVANPIPHAYRLEVSSPGIDRPLRRERDFARFAGSAAKIKTTEAVEGRRNFQGVIRGAKDGVVDVECDGRSYQLPLDAIARANLVPDWAAEFRRAGGQRAPLDDRREGGAGDPSRGAPADSTNRSAS